MSGSGVYTIQTSKGMESYSGEFKENRFHGDGVYTFANGSSYRGQWVDNRMEGSGCYSDTSGELWSGMFVDGKFDSRNQSKGNGGSSSAASLTPPQ